MANLEPIKLIVGLGNPGPEYQDTRHNAGANFVLQLAQQYKVELQAESKFFGLCAQVRIGSQSIRLLNPTTYMNLSGKAVAAIAGFYKIPVENILVVHDELDLPPGIVRLKIGGSGGGNGVRDIIQSLGNQKSFRRLRIGIGHPGNARDVTNYVLKKPSSSDRESIQLGIDNALAVLPALVEGEWEAPMKKLHTHK